MHKNIQHIVCSRLGMSELEYCNFQVESGWDYLTDNAGNEQNKSILESSAMFWAWWRNEWNIRDQQFVEKVLDGDSCGLPGKAAYRIHHATIIHGHCGDGVLLDAGFTQLQMVEFERKKQLK